MSEFSMTYALLAIQHALLKAVPPQLRAVVADIDERPSRPVLYYCFYYDGEATEEMLDLWDCAGTEASADLPADGMLDQQMKRVDYPMEIPLRGCYAYCRDESTRFPHKKMPPSIHYDTKKIAGETIPIAYAMLAVQNALLGIVTPELRGVVVDVDEQAHLFYLHFYYHGEMSEERIDIWQAAIQSAHEDLGSDYLLDAGIERCDWPKKFPFRGRYAYWRKEELKIPAHCLIGFALLGMGNNLRQRVTPELRAVVVDVDTKPLKPLLYLRFYYDGRVSKKILSLWEYAGSNTGDWLPNCVVDQGAERLDYPKEIPLRGYYAYLRDESMFSPPKKIPPSIHYDIKKITDDPDPHRYAMLAAQSSLLGIVTPELRAVMLEADERAHSLYLRFYYHGEVSKERIDIWRVATKVIHETLGLPYALDAGVERCDEPKKILFRDSCVYSRKEDRPQAYC